MLIVRVVTFCNLLLFLRKWVIKMNIGSAQRGSANGFIGSCGKRIAVTILICSIILGGISLLPTSKVAYAINCEGEKITVYSSKDDVDAALEQAGISLRSGDTYTLEDTDGSINVTVIRHNSVDIVCDGLVTHLNSRAETVAQALEEADITVGCAARLNHDPEAPLLNGMVITVTRGVQFCPEPAVLREQTDLSVQPEISLDAVKTGISYLTYTKDYFANIAEYTPLTVQEKQAEAERLAAEAEEAERRAAAEEIKNNKSYSLSERAAAARLLSGATAELSMESVELTDENGIAVDSEGNPLSYSQVINMTATAYCFDSSPNTVTASGVVPYIGTVAVDLKLLPLGTKVYVTSADGSWVYGYSTVEDTGVRGKVIDLFLDSYDECINFGVRKCLVYVLD